jgi:hypothetical protein
MFFPLRKAIVATTSVRRGSGLDEPSRSALIVSNSVVGMPRENLLYVFSVCRRTITLPFASMARI